ncbi:hypothetical protein [Fodinicola acaciae]|uniref:hypothetical protein n=1 Tax=Fodinicola acaciae TaxID=2681555 RepID=UPI0013D169BF|nr:hypothetical protein [Fodinicola acaciae]
MDFPADMAKTALRASVVPVSVHLLAAGGVVAWAVAQVTDPAQRGGWGPIAAVMTVIFLGLPIVVASLIVALVLTAALAARLRSAIAIGSLATVAGMAVTAAIVGLLHVINQG